jgi:hypothetical protein
MRGKRKAPAANEDSTEDPTAQGNDTIKSLLSTRNPQLLMEIWSCQLFETIQSKLLSANAGEYEDILDELTISRIGVDVAKMSNQVLDHVQESAPTPIPTSDNVRADTPINPVNEAYPLPMETQQSTSGDETSADYTQSSIANNGAGDNECASKNLEQQNGDGMISKEDMRSAHACYTFSIRQDRRRCSE